MFEDAGHCIQTAAQAGFLVAAVKDPAAQSQWEQICAQSHYAVSLDQVHWQAEVLKKGKAAFR